RRARGTMGMAFDRARLEDRIARMVLGAGIAHRTPLRLPPGPAFLPMARRFDVGAARGGGPDQSGAAGARRGALRPPRDPDREGTPRFAAGALRHLRRPQLPASVGRTGDRGGGGEALVGARGARQGRRGRPRQFLRQAGPHLSPALARHPGRGRHTRGVGLGDDASAACRGDRARRRRVRRAVQDYFGGAVGVTSSLARIVTGLVNSSEFGTTTTSPWSLRSRVTRSLTSVIVPSWPSKVMWSPIRMCRSSRT